MPVGFGACWLQYMLASMLGGIGACWLWCPCGIGTFVVLVPVSFGARVALVPGGFGVRVASMPVWLRCSVALTAGFGLLASTFLCIPGWV